jgi:hypothetical protein
MLLVNADESIDDPFHGRRTGSRKVFSLANTRVMKTPSGLASRKTTRRKTPI